MKFFVLLFSLLFSPLLHAFCMSAGNERPSILPLWSYFPIYSIVGLSVFALVFYIPCFIAKKYSENKKMNYSLMLFFWFLLYGVLFVSDFVYSWSYGALYSETFTEHLAPFVALYFLIYRSTFLSFFEKMSRNHIQLIGTFLFFCLSLIYFFDDRGGVDCFEVRSESFSISVFIAIFVWGFFGWLIFSRKWRVLISSLPVTYLFFILAREISFFTLGRYHFESLSFLRFSLLASSWPRYEMYYLRFAFVFLFIQLGLYYFSKWLEERKRLSSH